MEASVVAILQALDQATNDVAARLTEILQNNNASADLIAAIQPEIDKLNGIGKTDPTSAKV